MPFLFDIKLDPVQVDHEPPSGLILARWLAPARKMLRAGTAIAELKDGAQVWHLRITKADMAGLQRQHDELQRQVERLERGAIRLRRVVPL